jgi:HAT1-interacting factor 1
MGGVLGTALGESPADAAARVEEAKKTATDLTGLVRKKVKSEATPEPAASTNGKRKADDDTENSDAKKAKV